MSQHEHGRRFHELHQHGTFVIPNAWDAASAAVIGAAGPAALATTSSGISWTHGVADGESLSAADTVAVVGRIARAVDIPVSADIEAGYGPAPSDVAAVVDAVIEAGAVGVNLEDRSRGGAEELRPVADQCERLAAARSAADSVGIPFVVNARTDVYLADVGEPAERLALVIERAEAYAQAGADCLFVPGVLDLDTIGMLARTSPLPLNVLLAPGSGPSISQLAEAGARRISLGHAIASAAYAAVRRATEQLLTGRDTALADGIPQSEIEALLAAPPEFAAA